jgi:hypothetical protein
MTAAAVLDIRAATELKELLPPVYKVTFHSQPGWTAQGRHVATTSLGWYPGLLFAGPSSRGLGFELTAGQFFSRWATSARLTFVLTAQAGAFVPATIGLCTFGAARRQGLFAAADLLADRVSLTR